MALMKSIGYLPRAAYLPSANGWGERHLTAIHTPQQAEVGIVKGLAGWIDYAKVHVSHYDSEIGDDGVLGPAWARWGAALRELLNGDLGRLDGGTLDTILCTNLEAQGFNPDDL